MPIKKGKGNRPQVTITLDPEDVEYLDRRSGNDSRSRVAREIIQAERQRDGREEVEAEA